MLPRRLLPQVQAVLRHSPMQLRSVPHAYRSARSYSADSVVAPATLDENERKIFDMLKESLQPSKLEVQDVSGGCGSMYALDIVSEKFKGLTMIKQQQLVNKILAEEIKKWHGVRLNTRAPQ